MYTSTYHCFSSHYFYVYQHGISSAILSPTHSVSCSSLCITAYYCNLMEKQAHYSRETHALFHWLRGCLCWRCAGCLNFFPANNRGLSVHSHPLPRGAGLIEAPSSAKRAKDHMHNTPLFPYCWQLSPNRLLMEVTYPHSPQMLPFSSTTASQ